MSVALRYQCDVCSRMEATTTSGVPKGWESWTLRLNNPPERKPEVTHSNAFQSPITMMMGGSTPKRVELDFHVCGHCTLLSGDGPNPQTLDSLKRKVARKEAF